MRTLCTFFLTTLMFAVAAVGAPVDEAKGRMRERVPVIDALKRSEAVGENNRGYLEVRKDEGEAAEVVAGENTDRRVVFADAAARSGASAEVVGRSFARQIASASAPGVWLQRENGEWYKK